MKYQNYIRFLINTTLMCLFLKTSVAQATFPHNGLFYTTLGNASAQITSEGKLRIADLKTPEDGVSIHFGEAEFGVVTLEEFNRNTLPIGASRTMSVFGTVNGENEALIGSLQTAHGGETTDISADFSAIGVNSFTVKVFNNGEEVANLNDATGILARILDPVMWCAPWDPYWMMDDELWAIIDMPLALNIQLENQPVVTGDRLVFIGSPMADVSQVSRINITGNNLSEFTIERAELGIFHLPHSGSSVNLTAENNQLHVSGMNAGDNSVTVRLDEVVSWGITTDNNSLNPAILPTGAFIEYVAKGKVNGEENAVAFTTRYEDIGDEKLLLTGSFTGASSVTVNAYLDNQLVHSYSGHSGGIELRTTTSGPPTVETYTYYRNGNLKSCQKSGGITSVTVGDSQEIPADQIEVIPENQTAVVEYLSEVQINGQNVGSLVILGEEASSLYENDEFTIDFAGLQNTPIGESTLQPIPEGLIVTSGGTTNEGISIATGKADFFSTVIDGGGPDVLTTGANIELAADIKTVENMDINNAFSVRIADEGELFSFRAFGTPYNLGQDPFSTCNIYVDGFLMGTQDNWDLVFFSPRGCYLVLRLLNGNLIGSLSFTEATEAFDANQQSLGLIDRIEFILSNLNVTPTFITDVDITTSDIPSLLIKTESIGKFGNEHTSINNATLSAENNSLTISNFDPTVEAGVAINIGTSRGFNLELEPITDIPLDSSIKLGSKGKLGNLENSSLGYLEIQNNGSQGGYDIFADYSESGTTSKRIEIYDDGQLVDEFSGFTNDNIGTMPVIPKCCGKGIPPQDVYCYVLRPEDDVVFALSNGEFIQGDEIRVLAEDSNGSIEYLSEFSITAENVPEFTIIQEELIETSLPIELLSFSATKTKEHSIQLTWTVSNEQNIQYFALEKSTDNKNWTNIGKVTAKGSPTSDTHYEFIDQDFQHHQAATTYYYRLKIVEEDDSFNYSEVRSIHISKQEKWISVYPNPTKEGVYIHPTLAFEDEDITLKLVDATGKTVLTKDVHTSANGSFLALSDLPSGLYFIEFSTQDSVLQLEQIVIE